MALPEPSSWVAASSAVTLAKMLLLNCNVLVAGEKPARVVEDRAVEVLMEGGLEGFKGL